MKSEKVSATEVMSLVSGASKRRCDVAWSPTMLMSGVLARRALWRLASPLPWPGPRCKSAAAGDPVTRP